MPSNYPGGQDTFYEPEQPESTSLAQPGSQPSTPANSARNHYEHHRDLGDAVEALQAHAALRNHDHSGDGTSRFTGAKLSQVNTHQNADTDTATTALHHTLGTGANQAAAGNHRHVYPTGSTYATAGISNAPWVMCTSDQSSYPVGAPRGTVVYETDTNRARVLAQFSANNVTITGINSTDTFDRGPADNMGSTLWQQVYTYPTGRGKMGTTGNHCEWIDEGNDPNRCVARRISPSDAVTLTDNQIITWRFETDLEVSLPFTNSTSASNDMYFRMNTAATSYLRLVFSYDQWARGRITLYATKDGPANEQEIGSISTQATSQADVYWVATLMTGANADTLTVTYGPTLEGSTYVAGQLSIPANAANKGGDYRGWGIGMVAGNREGLAGSPLGSGQVTPASLSLVNIKDVTYQTGQEIWQLLPIGNVPTVRLAQHNKSQTIEPSGSLIEWTEEIEDNFAYFTPANSTKIRVADGGLYLVNIGIQWAVSFMPETAIVEVLVNGTVELHKSQIQLRPLLGSSSMTNTMTLSGQLRLPSGCEVTIRCRYGQGTFTTKLQTFFDLNSRIKSRLEMRFLGP